jgi:hypothetical protein
MGSSSDRAGTLVRACSSFRSWRVIMIVSYGFIWDAWGYPCLVIRGERGGVAVPTLRGCG